MSVVGLDVAALKIEFGNAEAFDDLLRRLAGVDADAAVALLFRVVEGPVRPSLSMNSGLRSAACALSSCTQTTSARCVGSQSKKPLVAAERMPLRLADIIRIKIDSRNCEKCPITKPNLWNSRSPRRCCVWRVQTKAGRMTPYFFNAGLFNDGDKLKRLGEFYAKAIVDSGMRSTCCSAGLQGDSAGCSIAIALAGMGRNVPYAYNRKEAKDHGEGGTVVARSCKAC